MNGLDKLTTDDRFELLSAYLDNELSVEDRKQVEAWLASDPEMRQQYQSLATLSRSFQAMPMPQSESSTDAMLDAVFTKVERKPRILKLAGISAVVIAMIGAIGALVSGPTFSPQMAKQGSPEGESQPSNPSINTALSTNIVPVDIESLDTDSLMLVLEAPPVDIPVVDEDTTLTDAANF